MVQSLQGKKIVGAAIATPLTSSGSVDTDRLIRHGHRLLNHGVNSLAFFGTTGEGSAFSARERLGVIERAVDAGLHACALGVGVFEQSSDGAASQIRDAFSAGAHYALICPPYYFKDVSDVGLYRWFSEVIEGVGDTRGAFVLYHIPQVSMVPVSTPLTLKLQEAFPDRLLGVKDSAGDWAATRERIKACEGLSVLVGHEGQIANGMREGALGSICALANVVPADMANIIQNDVDDPRVTELIELAARGFLVGAVKDMLAAQYNDQTWRAVTAPLEQTSEKEATEMVNHLRRLFSDAMEIAYD